VSLTRASETEWWIRYKGREKTKDTALEMWGDPLLRSLGYEPLKGVKVRMTKSIIEMAGDWRPQNVEEVFKEPDRVVSVASGLTKVILLDGWAVHNRTMHQQQEKERENSLYNAAGYYVVRIGEWWSKNRKRTEELKPILGRAMVSRLPVVDLTT
jgi:hypothetical protein